MTNGCPCFFYIFYIYIYFRGENSWISRHFYFKRRALWPENLKIRLFSEQKKYFRENTDIPWIIRWKNFTFFLHIFHFWCVSNSYTKHSITIGHNIMDTPYLVVSWDGQRKDLSCQIGGIHLQKSNIWLYRASILAIWRRIFCFHRNFSLNFFVF